METSKAAQSSDVLPLVQNQKNQIPDVLPPVQDKIQPPVEMEAGDSIEAIPAIQNEELVKSVTIHDDLVVTPFSSVKLLRDGCKWLEFHHQVPNDTCRTEL